MERVEKIYKIIALSFLIYKNSRRQSSCHTQDPAANLHLTDLCDYKSLDGFKQAGGLVQYTSGTLLHLTTFRGYVRLAQCFDGSPAARSSVTYIWIVIYLYFCYLQHCHEVYYSKKCNKCCYPGYKPGSQQQ